MKTPIFLIQRYQHLLSCGIEQCCVSRFHRTFYITACSMLNPADALTNIELAVKRKSYSLLNWTVYIPPGPYLSWRSTTAFINLINYFYGFGRGNGRITDEIFWAYIRSSTRSWKTVRILCLKVYFFLLTYQFPCQTHKNNHIKVFSDVVLLDLVRYEK